MASYIETHFEVVAELMYQLDGMYHPNLVKLYEQQGRGVLWKLAKSVTDEFEELNKDREWNGEWMDEVQEFVYNKINKL